MTSARTVGSDSSIRWRGLQATDRSDMCARAIVASFYVAFAWRLTEDFFETGRITSLLVLISELLVAVMTTFRRPAVAVDRSLPARVVTAVSVIGPLCVQPVAARGIGDIVTTPLVMLGLVVIIAGQLSLGRSFGVIPANRGVITSGLYVCVRHPIYAGYMTAHLGFVLGNPSIWNVLLFVLADLALIRRAIREERTLKADPRYRGYCATTRWRLIPGVY